MNKRLLELRQRRGELIANIDTQREQIAAVGMRWQNPLAIADKGLLTVRFLRANPLLIATAVALLYVRRSGIASTTKFAWRIWKLYKTSQATYARVFSLLRH